MGGSTGRPPAQFTTCAKIGAWPSCLTCLAEMKIAKEPSNIQVHREAKILTESLNACRCSNNTNNNNTDDGSESDSSTTKVAVTPALELCLLGLNPLESVNTSTSKHAC